jgi:hypothetical protein
LIDGLFSPLKEREVRKLHQGGARIISIAIDMKINEKTVSSVIKYQSWKNVK